MTGAFFEIDRRGRIINVFIVGGTEADVETVQQALARVTRPGAWAAGRTNTGPSQAWAGARVGVACRSASHRQIFPASDF